MGSLILPGYLYWDGFKYVTQQVSSTLTGPAGGDLSGTYPNPSVVRLNGNPVSAAVPSTGQILEWNGTTWGPATGSFFTAGGDLSGTSTSQTVTGLQGNPVSSTAPTTGQVLEWNGSSWGPAASSGTLAGDVTGATNSNTVVKIQNNPVQAQTLGAGQSNYALVWNGSIWSAENVFLNQSAGGDLGDFYPNPTTRALWHAAIPEVLPSNPGATTGFVIGNVLQVTNVTANTQALGYGTLNLGTGSSTTNTRGILPQANQAPQSVTGDLSGYTNGNGSAYNGNSYGATVTKIQNIPVESISLGLSQDGYVLTYSYADARWEPKSSTTGASLAGDVTGGISNTHLAEIQGYNVAASAGNAPALGEVLTYNYNSVTGQDNWFPQTLTLSITGDVVGNTILSGTANTRVVAIQDNPVKNTILGATQDGYVLTWNNTDRMWEAIINAGGEGAFVAGGDLAGVSTDQTVIKINHTSVPASPTANTVLIASNGTTANWGFITDVNVSSGAGIAGSKINMTTGGIGSIVASSNIQASTFTATSEIFLNSGSGPTIRAGSGLPSGSPADGSIWLRTDGATDGTESIYSYEGSGWVPVGAASAGAAGGDLAGFYPNPTVVAIQKNPVDNTMLSATQDGYVLTWNNTANEWKAEPSAVSSITLSGDVTGPSSATNVVAIHGTSVPASPTTYQVLSATSGTTATWGLLTNNNISNTAGIVYSKLSLTGSIVNADVSSSASIAVSKLAAGSSAQILLSSSTPTPTWTTMSADVTISSLGATTVNSIQGVVISGTPQDGYILEATSPTAASWQAAASGSFSAGGDLSGTSTNQIVESIQGVVITGTPVTGYVLEATSSSAATWQPAASGSFSAGGDLTGSSTNQTVHSIQGVVISGTPQDGYVLEATSSSAATWQPFSGGGGETGKVIYTTKTITANYATDSSEYDYFIFCNQTGPINVTLPSPVNGRTVVIKDITNNAFTNQITVLPYGSETIDGAGGSFVISSNLGSATFAADASGNWWIV